MGTNGIDRGRWVDWERGAQDAFRRNVRVLAGGREHSREDGASRGPRKRALVAGVSMGVAALLFLVLSAGFSGGPGTVSDTAAPGMSSLQEQI
ncbi:hypothetical protein [Streptomyces cyaneofuscatus]|uniref:hypothetical protein n=1 Tax=Streptomyces cyaneofuscatus TaxID=66883 RepID=UPI003658C85D